MTGDILDSIVEHKESANYIYGGTNNVAESCNTDARTEQDHVMEIFSKLQDMETARNSDTFYVNRNQILDNLSKIRNSMAEKVRDCSRG